MNSLPEGLLDFFAEQKARYGELFWYEQKGNQIILMIEKLAIKAREIIGSEGNSGIEVTSFENNHSIGEFYLVESEQKDVEQRPDKVEYKTIMDKDLDLPFTDLTNDLYQDQLVRVYQRDGYSSFCVAAYHSFGLKAPRGPIGWLKNLRGLKKIGKEEFVQPEKLKSLGQACQDLEGVKYRLGGGSFKNGFDCSALVQRIVYETKGIWLPRKVRWQALVCEPISLEDIQPGDLAFFKKSGQGNIDHVAFVFEIQSGKLPMVFHTKRLIGKAVFQDLNTAEWLFSLSNESGKWETSGYGRIAEHH